MVELKMLEEKRDYLNSLRPLTDLELQMIKAEFVIANTKSKTENSLALSDEEKMTLIDNKLSKDGCCGYFYSEVQGVLNAYNYIEKLLDKERISNNIWPMSEEELKQMNKIILDTNPDYQLYEKGEYRFRLLACYIPNRRCFPKNDIFPKRLEGLIRWYNHTNKDFFTKLALFHLIFEYDIHPFYDGNGRVGRMIMGLELARMGYPLIGIKGFDRKLYYDTFEEWGNSRNVDPMRDLITSAIDKQLNKQILIRERH